jgi:ferric-dicitrate binding protein FerR (iron transport regulator)
VYHSDIKLNDEQLKNCRVTTSFDNQSLEEVLIVLKATLDLTIQKTGPAIIISGKGC